MTGEQVVLSLLNGFSYGLLLFLLSAGLTLIFSMMGVLNFAHASFYMLGAYLAYSLSGSLSFWVALVAAPALVAILGGLFEKLALRKVHRYGHVPELLVTFGLSYLLLEAVQLVWGRAPVPFTLPSALQGPLFTFAGAQFPKSRAFIMLIALLMLVALWLLLTKTRVGLVIQAALTHPEMVEALGHNVPLVFTGVFAGGAALAGLAGVIGGSTYVTEPSMSTAMGSIVFVVVVVGGMGSLSGAFVASILIGLVQTFAVAIDTPIASLLPQTGAPSSASPLMHDLMQLSVARVAPILPYLLLVLMLVFRPRGLLGGGRADR